MPHDTTPETTWEERPKSEETTYQQQVKRLGREYSPTPPLRHLGRNRVDGG